MNGLLDERPMRLAILQRVCAGYRVKLFSRIASEPKVDAKLFIGADILNTKVRSASTIEGTNFRKLDTRFMNIGRRTLTWHIGLVGELRKFNPYVILCEGESHFIGYWSEPL